MNVHGEQPSTSQPRHQSLAREPAVPSSDPGRGELAGMDQGMRVLSYLIAGVLVYGGLGWVADRYLGTGFLLPIGIVLGAAGGCYVIARRYGQVLPAGAAEQSPGDARETSNQEREGAR